MAQFGYHRSSTNIETDTYYRRPDRDFMATVECPRVPPPSSIRCRRRPRSRWTFVETEVIALDAAKAVLFLEETEQNLGVTEYPVVKLPYRDLVLRHAHKR